MATLVYLLEFIVGDIFDEYDVYREDLKIIEPDKKIQVEGLTAIQDILDFFEMDNPDIWISFTVVGLIMEEMGRIPQLGDDCKIEGLHFKVIESEKGRIKRVNIKQVLNQPIESIK
ncbi:transporter associated domain-containing protein [Eremococcus coleocola]|uniref:transporter associated domain-containing protein n=1 Tax=Eremococcus coleocola TaxID=88132 RepID=UPI00200B345F|nr:transporter associated domain-containing protein [Eremococcus coleocola]